MLKGFVSRIALLASWLGVFAAPAHAADFGAFNQAYARNVVAPAFKRVAVETAKLAQAADDFAGAPSQDGFAALRVAFDSVSDAWMHAGFFSLGPLEEAQRAERFEYFPERRNIVDRQLGALLAAPDPKSLSPEEFPHASVSVQGLPALERLLYGDNARQVLSAGPDQKARIAVIQAIAHNLETLGREVAVAWEKASAEPAPFANDPTETTNQAYGDILTGIQVIADRKVSAVLGKEIDKAHPGSAEQYRSGRSLRNIRANLDALRAAVLGPDGFATLLPPDRAALKDEIAKAFDATIAAAGAVPEPLDAAVADPEKRKSVETLLTAANALRSLMTQKVPSAIGLTVGFNAMDGDGL
ncbi:MAG TPA: imelysin family protein [Dongiaceae bacterium]|jgi:predicted lipoprotein|nr:imelysin family protein [Dongiaceae bacterium]